MTLSEMYDDLRKQPSPSQKLLRDLAELTCRSIQTVKLWITGQQTPPESVRRKIADYLEKDADELFPPKN